MFSSDKPKKIVSITAALMILASVNGPMLMEKAVATPPDLHGSDIEVSDNTPLPPVTDPPPPPVTDPPPPPVTDPQPPVTDPPVTDPPVTYPPVTYPPTPNNDTTDRQNAQEQLPANTAPETTVPSAPTPAIPSPIEKYQAAEEYFTDTELSNKTITSKSKDENALLVSGGNVTLSKSTVTRTGNDSTTGKNSADYGVGAAILAINGTAFLSKDKINSNAPGATGVFSFGSGTVCIADSTVSTSAKNSAGFRSAATGKLFAWDTDVSTSGDNSSPIASGEGSGTVRINGGDFKSAGANSPAVACSADIDIINASLSAEKSGAAIVKGAYDLTVRDSALLGSMKDSKDTDCTWTVAVVDTTVTETDEEGNETVKLQPGSFSIKGGSITSKNGGLFYTTNAQSRFYIENVEIKPSKNSEFLLRCTANGKDQNSGADCNFTAANQKLEGNIVWDAASKLSLYITKNSMITSAFLENSDFSGNSTDGYADLHIDSDCKWVVAGDSKLTSVYNGGTIEDTSGNTVTVKDPSGRIFVEGTSAYTVITDNYYDKAEMKNALKAPKWTAKDVKRPTALGASSVSHSQADNSEEQTTPALIDKETEKRKTIAVFMLIGVGVLIAGTTIFMVYNKNKYKYKKK